MTSSSKTETKDQKIDKALQDTFPASDPPAVSRPTSTEEPLSRTDRKAPIIRKEDIEAAQDERAHEQR